jgi:hypothetical protein
MDDLLRIERSIDGVNTLCCTNQAILHMVLFEESGSKVVESNSKRRILPR